MAWKLLSETRRQCLYAALAGISPVVLLIFIQTVSGKWEGAINTAWGWVLLTIMPILLVLWANALLNRYPSKIIHPTAHIALMWGSWTYVLLVFLTLLTEPFATRDELSMVQYFSQSYWWLLPLEGVLLTGYGLVFFKKDSFFKPNEQIILDFAVQKAADWKSEGNLLRQQCFELIAANKLLSVFPIMKKQFEKTYSDDLNAIVLLENQFTELSRQRDLNLVERGEAQIILNRIVMALMNLVERL